MSNPHLCKGCTQWSLWAGGLVAPLLFYVVILESRPLHLAAPSPSTQASEISVCLSTPMEGGKSMMACKWEIFFFLKTKAGNGALQFHSHFIGQSSITCLLVVAKETGKSSSVLRKNKKWACNIVILYLCGHVLYWSRSS